MGFFKVHPLPLSLLQLLFTDMMLLSNLCRLSFYGFVSCIFKCHNGYQTIFMFDTWFVKLHPLKNPNLDYMSNSKSLFWLHVRIIWLILNYHVSITNCVLILSTNPKTKGPFITTSMTNLQCSHFTFLFGILATMLRLARNHTIVIKFLKEFIG